MKANSYLVSVFSVSGQLLMELGPAVAAELAELNCSRQAEQWMHRVQNRCERAARKQRQVGFAPAVRIGVWGDELRPVLEFAKRHGLRWLTNKVVDHVQESQERKRRYV